MNIESLQGAIDQAANEMIRAQNYWFEEQVKKHLPSVAALHKMGMVDEAVQQITEMGACRVYRRHQPFWIGLQIHGEIVAYKDFDPQPPFVTFGYEQEDERTIAVRELGIDNILNPDGRAERKRRQKEMGALFVKYGIAKPTAY